MSCEFHPCAVSIKTLMQIACNAVDVVGFDLTALIDTSQVVKRI